MSRMKKIAATFCAISCYAFALAAPASAQSPDSGCARRISCRPSCFSIENSCPELEQLIAQLKDGCPDLFLRFPSSCAPEVAPPTAEAPEDRPQTPPSDETPGPSEGPNEDNEPDVPDENEGGAGSETEGLSAYEAQVVSLVNAERAAAGLSPLAVNTELTQAARLRCKEQAVSFSHTRPNGARFSSVLDEAGIAYLGVGENIAYGQRSAEEVMQSWMDSPGHRANILRDEYTEIGVGCVQDASGILYWTQLFIYTD